MEGQGETVDPGARLDGEQEAAPCPSCSSCWRVFPPGRPRKPVCQQVGPGCLTFDKEEKGSLSL